LFDISAISFVIDRRPPAQLIDDEASSFQMCA
jgi:hypothetical protein